MKAFRLGLLASALAVMPVAAQDNAEEDGGGFLENLIESRLSGPGFQVRVRGFRGALSSRATVGQITISDDEGAWLTVNDAVLDWNRGALLRGRLSVTELTAGEIIVPRLPQSQNTAPDVPDPEAKPFSLPELPVSIQIDRIAAERVDLGQPVIGEAAVMSLEGSAQLAGGEGEVDVNAERTDGQRGIFRVSGSFENESRQLTLDLNVDEGADGIVVNLADIPGRPSIEASVQGEGPLSEFDAQIRLATDGEDRLAGSVALRETDGASGFAVDLGGDVTALFSPTYRPFFGPDVQLQATGAKLADGGFRLENLDLTAQSLRLAGEVTIGADGVPDLIDVTGEIASADGPVLLPVGESVRVDRVGLDVQFDAAQGETWTGDVTLEGLDQPGLEIARVALDGQGVIRGSGESLAVTAGFDFDTTGISTDDGGVEQALGDTLTGRAQIDYAANNPIALTALALNGSGFSLNGTGSLDPAGENVPVTLNARLAADDLSLFAALVDQPLAGGLTADLDLAATLRDQGFDVTLTGQGADLAIGNPRVDPLLAGQTALDLQAMRDATGLRISQLLLQNPQLDVTGSAEITSSGGNVRLNAGLTDLSRVDPTLAGDANLALLANSPDGQTWSVDLRGAGAGAQVTGDIVVTDVGVENTSPAARGTLEVAAENLANFSIFAGRDLGGAVDLSAEGSTRFDLSELTVLLQGTTQDVAVGIPEVNGLMAGGTTLEIRAAREGERIEVPAFSIQNPQITAEGTARVAPGDSSVVADVNLSELSRVVAQMSGPAIIRLRADEEGPVWDVDLAANGAGADVAARAAVRGLRGDAPRSAEGTFSVAARDLAVFSNLANRDLAGAFALEGSGSGMFDLSTLTIEAQGSAQDLVVGIDEVDNLMAGRTQLAIDARKEGTSIDVRALDVTNPQIEVTAEGSYGSNPDDTVNADVTVFELSRILPDLSGRAEVRLRAEEANADWNVNLDASGAGADVQAQGVVSDLGIVGSPRAEGTARVQVADLSRFSAIAGRELGGQVDVNAEGQARFDLTTLAINLSGSTTDIAVGIPEVNRLMAGRTAIALDAERDDDVIVLRDLAFDNDQIDVTGAGTYGRPGNDDQVRLSAVIADLARIVPAMSGGAEVRLTADEGSEGWTVDLTGEGAGADVALDALVRGLEGAETPSAEGTLRAQVPDLGAFSEIAKRQLGGRVDLTATGNAAFDLARAALTAEGTIDDLRVGVEAVDNLLRGATSIDIEAAKDGDVVTVPRFLITNPQIEARGEGGVGPGQTAADARITVAELGAILPQLAGRAEVVLEAEQRGEGWDVALTGSGMGTDLEGQARITGLGDAQSPQAAGTVRAAVADLAAFSEIAGRDLGGAAVLTARGNARLDLSEAQVTVGGTTQDLVLGQAELTRLFRGETTLDLSARKSGEAIRLPALSLENPQVRLTGEAGYGPGQNAAQIRALFPELGRIVPELTGEGRVELFAEEVGQAWQVSADVEAPGVSLDTIATVSELGSDAGPRVEGDVTARVDQLGRFSRIAGRSLAGSLNLQAQGSGRVDGSRFDVTANVDGQGLRVGVPQADQLLAGGATTVALSAEREGARAPIRVRSFALDAPGLDATAQGNVLGGASDLTFRATLANLGTFVPELNGPLTAQGQLGQAGQSVTLNVSLAGPSGTNARVQGRIQQTFDSANINATGSVPLGLANPFIEPRALQGTAAFDLALNGPLALSSLTGTVRVPDGRFIEPNVPVVLNNVNITARLDGSSVSIDARANKEDGGSLAANGTVALQPGYQANLTATLNALAFEDPRLYRTTVDGEVRLTGPLAGNAQVAGTLRLGETDLRIPTTGLGATGPVPDGLVNVGTPGDVAATLGRAGLTGGGADEGASSGGGGGGYALDLTILAPNRIFVRGRGLDAELGGQLALQGTTANVIPSGRFELIRGRLDLLGKRIVLDEGAITLQGDFTPTIRLVARTDAGDVTVVIIVEGPAVEPDIEFTSEPQLPQDEVLARLLFGRSVSDISPLQAAQLANAVATLAGRGGTGIVGNLRNATGLDDLDITTDSEGNVGLRAGRYISENVYTDVTVGASGEAEINLNLDLTDSITVRGSASNSGNTGLGIYYEKDY